MINKKLIKKLLSLILPALAFANASAEVLKHVEQTSRDHYYIQLKNPTFSMNGFVGGEHTNFYHILAFTGEAFTIDFGKSNPQHQWSLGGNGVDVLQKKGITTATANSDGSWITIEISAYPQPVEYELTITRYP